jgi:apolipoprotein N-acyltransferase
MVPARQIRWRESAQLLLTSLVTSLLLLLSMPGRFGWWPLIFIALIPLLAFAARKGPRLSFSAGLLTGFFYHAGMLYWIVIVLGRYGGLPLALSLPSMLLLAVCMGMYTALFTGLLSYLLSREKDNSRVPVRILFAAPVLWVGLDWLRGILFSGFPWMDLGYGLYSQPVLLQIADLGGHHLVTFVLVLINGSLFFVVDMFRHGNTEETARKVRFTVSLAVVFLLLAGSYSVLRYQQLSRVVETSTRLQVAVVQGNIPQDEKWTPASKKLTLDVYKGLSGEAVSNNNSTLVVWPETALPFFPVNDPLFSTVTGWAANRDLWLLTGAPYFVINSDLQRSFKNAVSYFNSALLINPTGKVAGRYDKQHLVPFGEYVPLRKFLPFLEPLVESVGNFSFGSSSVPLSMGAVQLGILICYESIFPDLARQEVAAGANVLVNITNDAWYGRSSAPYQSFSMSVLRAVETRRSLVRAANTGISGFVDPVGRVMEQTPIFEALALSADVPILEEKTIFTSFGYLFAPACLLLVSFMVVARRRKK